MGGDAHQDYTELYRVERRIRAKEEKSKNIDHKMIYLDTHIIYNSSTEPSHAKRGVYNERNTMEEVVIHIGTHDVYSDDTRGTHKKFGWVHRSVEN
ncbi:hypothetical protein Y032_0169g208 [Ancylostoma ceylanicum]|uniref:Uncharacterized protein n=1 Tax=Ancylostoma ceylanicum TaxID=53326 RepID=A0A016SW53_9BILA|nr:hypothetical protein Y032_0169g208 [Ancylostoma ceylanicum]